MVYDLVDVWMKYAVTFKKDGKIDVVQVFVFSEEELYRILVKIADSVDVVSWRLLGSASSFSEVIEL